MPPLFLFFFYPQEVRALGEQEGKRKKEKRESHCQRPTSSCDPHKTLLSTQVEKKQVAARLLTHQVSS
jgi:hypothetical protein